MTFSDIIAGSILMTLFLIGFSQAAVPLLQSWERSTSEYQTARSIAFVAASFRNACGDKERNMEKWKKAVSIVRELESCEIEELWDKDVLRALKARCIIAGEQIDIIGLCTP